MILRPHLCRLQIAEPINQAATASAASVHQKFAGSGPVTVRPLPGWVGFLFAVLVAIATSSCEPSRHPSPDSQALVNSPLFVSGELLQVHARRNLSFERHAVESATGLSAVLSESRRESSGEGVGR